MLHVYNERRHICSVTSWMNAYMNVYGMGMNMCYRLFDYDAVHRADEN